MRQRPCSIAGRRSYRHGERFPTVLRVLVTRRQEPYDGTLSRTDLWEPEARSPGPPDGLAARRHAVEVISVW
jgi:hypothetical protein